MGDMKLRKELDINFVYWGADCKVDMMMLGEHSEDTVETGRFYAKCLTKEGDECYLTVTAQSREEVPYEVHSGYAVNAVIDVFDEVEMHNERAQYMQTAVGRVFPAMFAGR